ncbi:hypothetical protein [Psychromonas ossibalaenae]|uniref:hypothetical protein n=1 Tax=Psychromonas ossibalaenae TaxID=444922 RepID=UPI00037D31CD|nr:hypothetical protein [Psychromonas ossibalaenae]
MKQPIMLISLAAASLLMTLSPAQAQTTAADNSEQVTQESNNRKPKSKGPQTGKPPQTAIDACLQQTATAQCSFQGPKEIESGVCENTPDKQYFACKPDRKNMT